MAQIGLGGYAPPRVAVCLCDTAFPAHKQDLLAAARGADGQVLVLLERLPDDDYEGLQDVLREIPRELGRRPLDGA